MKTTLIHIWKNYKTTISNIIQSFLVYFMAKLYMNSDDAMLISSVLTSLWVTANVLMKKQ